MGELEHYLIWLGIGFAVIEVLGIVDAVEEIAIGMDGERLLGTSHAHIISAQHVIGRMFGLGDEHEYMVELMAFCLVDGTYHDVRFL